MILRIISITAFFVFLAGQGANAEPVYTLRDAYRSALASHETVQISKEDFIQAESRLDQAMTYLYPRLSGHADYTRYNEVLPPGSTNVVFQPLSQFQASLVLRQPLYTGGRTMAALRTARALRDASTKYVSSTVQGVMLNVAEAYYSAVKAQKMVEKSRDSVKRMLRHQEVTEREAATRKTKANISNLLRARTLVSQANIALTRDENNLRIARERLHFLTAIPVTERLAEPASGTLPVQDVDQLKALALQNRDDYAASALQERAAAENITIVKGGHYPQLYAEGAYRSTDSHPETALDGGTYYAGLRLDVPLFEGGLMKAELAEASSRHRQTVLSQQYLRRAIESEVYESYVNYRTLTSVLDAINTQYEDAKKNFAAVQRLFEQGLASSLALIDAQQALFMAEREQVNAVYDRELSILALKRSIGILNDEIEN